MPTENTPPELLARAQARQSGGRHRPWYLYAAAAVLALCAGGLWWFYRASPPPSPGELSTWVEATPPASELGFAVTRKSLPAKGQVSVLVLSARFQDEREEPIPGFADRLFDPELPGSFTHFYDTMSFGQLQVQGTVVKKRYASRRPTAAYLAASAGDHGLYSEFALEVLEKADLDLDFSQFDNNGPDGRPNSGDDDGVVDYVFLMVQSIPRNFILGGATGVAGLEFPAEYITADADPGGNPIRISGDRARGTLFQGGTFSQTAGTMAHEFGHGLGLPDLYDLSYTGPEEDSGGIGKWGLMGWGTTGWNGDDGPNPLCARSREFLGWIGRDNERLIEVRRDTTVRIGDLHQGGAIYKVPLRALVAEDEHFEYFEEEYLLLEQRVRAGIYYNRNLPAEGLLIWHIRPHLIVNTEEEQKVVDLVCADGTYADKGYPLGRIVNSYSGRDNLDFWAHDDAYSTAHRGNLGDATDPFDGVRFTRFDMGSNPSTNIEGSYPPSAFAGVAIESIRRQGAEMVVDVSLPRWAGTIRQKVYWLGDILVDGDLTIAPEGELVIYDNTRVRFAGRDRLRSGRDPRRCELIVEGKLWVESPHLYRRDRNGRRKEVQSAGIRFESMAPGQTWAGIFPGRNAELEVPEGSLTIRDSQFGLLAKGGARAALKPAGEEGGQSLAFRLLANYPNPFNQQTTIPYALPERSQVKLLVYNILGQVVRTLVDEFQEAGEQQVVWDGRDGEGQEVASGVYLYRLEVVGKYVQARQMTLVR